QFQERNNQGLRSWRTTLNVYIHRYNFINTLDNMIAMLPVMTTAIGTRTHTYDVSRLSHLLIQSPNSIGHLKSHPCRYNHNIGLSRGWPWKNPQSTQIV